MDAKNVVAAAIGAVVVVGTLTTAIKKLTKRVTKVNAPTEEGRCMAEASIERIERALSAGKVSGTIAAKKAIAHYKMYLGTGEVHYLRVAVESEAAIAAIHE